MGEARPKSRSKSRYLANWILIFCCMLLLAAEFRFLELQVLRGKDPADAPIYRRHVVVDEAPRGEILDARGGVLATSIREVDVRVWTSEVKQEGRRNDAELIAQRLSELTGVDPDAVKTTLAKRDQWTLLVRGVRDPGVIEDLRELVQKPGFRALSLETRYVREYPRGTLLTPLVGFVGWQPDDPDHPQQASATGEGTTRGVAGIERLYEAVLAGTPGRREVLRDGRQREMVDPALPETRARPGRSVELTLDPLAQAIVERTLDEAMEVYRPEWAQIIVLERKHRQPGGSDLRLDVAALGQRPMPREIRPGDPKDQKEEEAHKLLAAQHLYPPGSSFKPLMMAFILEKKAVGLEQEIDCENGLAFFGKRPIHDTHPHRLLSPTGILVESSNIGMAKLIQRCYPPEIRKGDARFQEVTDHVRSLGFGAPVAGLPGEENGIVPSWRTMARDWGLASISFGQEIAVTALQMSAACAALVGGGVYQSPRIVRAVEDEGGGFAEQRPLLERAADRAQPVPADVAATIKSMLVRVVEDGATRRWKPKGWSMGGKTGTAQHEKSHGLSTNSYWCFAPVNDPRFVVLVILDVPKKGRFAADNAGKVAGTLMNELLIEFEVPHDRPEELAADAALLADGAGTAGDARLHRIEPFRSDDPELAPPEAEPANDAIDPIEAFDGVADGTLLLPPVGDGQ